MSDAASNYLRDALNDHVHGGSAFSPPATYYFALMTAMPTAAGGGTEVTGGSYARVSVTNNSSNFPAASAGSKQNGNAIDWGTASANWGTILGVAWYDASSGGNLIGFAFLTVASVVNSGQPFKINANGATFNYAAGNAWSTYLQNKILDLVYSAAAWTRPATTYIGAFIVMPAADGTGGTEVTGGSYGRVTYTNSSGNWPASSGQLKQNAVVMNFGTASANWGLIAGLAEFDASSGGNMLVYKVLSNPTTVNNGNPFEIPVDGFQNIWQA